MASWFNVDSLKGFAEQVQQSIPTIDQDTLQKLTLSTPELTAERQRIEEEERHKEEIRDMLSGILPWETSDAERDILVDECKEAILQLSSSRDTFFGPYEMPKINVMLSDDKESGEAAVDPDENEEDNDGDENAAEASGPSKSSLEKLAKLEPLPPLLRDFDLDAHVGLIEKVLKEDPKLIQMQAKHSGAGEREKMFWRNYFFHCAYTRYEAGLSIDEIWSDNPDVRAKAPVKPVTQKVEEAEEETITFGDDPEQPAPEKAFSSDPQTDAEAPFTTSNNEAKDDASGGVASESTGFDMVEEDDGQDLDLTGADYELDELEAEIARELED